MEAGPAGPGRRPGRHPGAATTPRSRSSGGSAASRSPFRFPNRGDVAVIGRLSGVTNIPWLGPFGRQSGFLAWLLWLGIHIVYLIGFANRIVVSCAGPGRSSPTAATRLITGQPLLPHIEEPEPPA